MITTSAQGIVVDPGPPIRLMHESTGIQFASNFKKMREALDVTDSLAAFPINWTLRPSQLYARILELDDADLRELQPLLSRKQRSLAEWRKVLQSAIPIWQGTE